MTPLTEEQKECVFGLFCYIGEYDSLMPESQEDISNKIPSMRQAIYHLQSEMELTEHQVAEAETWLTELIKTTLNNGN